MTSANDVDEHESRKKGGNREENSSNTPNEVLVFFINLQWSQWEMNCFHEENNDLFFEEYFMKIYWCI